MQKPTLLGILLLIALSLTACNLGAGAVQEPTEVLQQATIVIREATQQATALPSLTPLPTQQPVSNNNGGNNNNTNNCSPRTDWATYTVVGGDTLSRIAVRGNTTVNTLVTANCLADANVISPGQVLRVPNTVIVATPIVVTSTSLPPSSNACRLTMTETHMAYYDQAYMVTQQRLNAGETYPVTGHNFWSYRIQLNGNQIGWLQKTISEQPTGNCGIVPEIGLSYTLHGPTRTDVCYFVPFGNDFPAYFDQAQTTTYFTMPSNQFYFVDARASNGYRIVSGENLPFPAWVSNNSGGLEGNCTTVPDFTVATTLDGNTKTFTPNDYPIAFEYPANWEVTRLGDGMGGYTLSTFPRFNSYPGASPVPSDIVRVGVHWQDKSRWSTPQAYAEGIVAEIRSLNAKLKVIQDPVAVTMQSGLEAYHIITSIQGANDEMYIFAIDGEIYMLSIYGNQSHAASIVETIRER